MVSKPELSLVTIDAGNTHSVFGLWQGQHLRSTCRLSTRADSTDWEWKILLAGWLGKHRPDAVAISSVVPAIVAPLKSCFREFFQCNEILEVHHELNLPFEFEYPGRETLGSDRIANAAGGVELYGDDLIIVDFGTAITYCLIENRKYKGGLIAPGIYTSMQALFQKTSRLPAVEFTPPEAIPGRDTIESIEAGAWYTWKGAVREILQQLRISTERPVRVIATGGIARDLPFASDFFDVVDRNLTLRGLLTLYHRNRPNG